MAKHIMLVHINAFAGRDAEFNEWYDTYHIKEVMATAGVVSAQRFKLSDAQLPFGESCAHKYLVIYEIEGDLAPFVAELTAPETAKSRTLSDAPDENNAILRLFTAMGPALKSVQ